MIPNLALMVSAYVGFRMIEVFLFPPSRYSSTTARVCAYVFAAIAFVVSVISTVDILMSGSKMP
jgi:hypothetical protein